MVENCCFFDFTKTNSKTYISSLTQIDIPCYMYRCLESINIIIKKYFYNTELIEEGGTKLQEIPIIEDAISSFDNISLLDALKTKKNAYEMLEYVQSIQDTLPEETYFLLEKTLKTRWDFERMYGSNNNKTISVIEKALFPEE